MTFASIVTSFVVVVVGLGEGRGFVFVVVVVVLLVFCLFVCFGVVVFLDGKSVMSIFCNVMMLLLLSCMCNEERLED